MINFIKRNINKDLIFTGLNQLWRLVSGPLMLILVPFYLTAEEQGFWYTFSSLAALAILADLGFSTIVLQFAAHEFAHLEFNEEKISGDTLHLQKLAKLFTFCVKWATGLSLIAFPIILFVGFIILTEKSTNVQWIFPWIIYGVSSAVVFINSTILYFFEGCNSVGRIQNIRLKIAICTFIVMTLLLVLKCNLYALSFSLLANAIFGIYQIRKEFWLTIKYLFHIAIDCTYSWKREFLSLIKRYAISWVSGYLTFQIYTPLAFHNYGPIKAGKIGISMALWLAVFTLSSIWINAITPKLNMYVSKKDWDSLDKIFFSNLLFSLATYIIGVFMVLVSMSILENRELVYNRFLDIRSMAILAACLFLQLIVNTLATYLRAHKEEPLVIPFFVAAIYIVTVTFLCSQYLSIEYLFIGYLSSYLFLLPWIISIFYKQRKIWHYD